MSKNAAFRRRRQRVGIGARFFWLIVGLVLGYLTTILWDASALGSWMHSFNKKPVPSEARQKIAQEQKEAPAVKPKFEFYTLLSKDNSIAPQANHAAAAELPTSAPVSTPVLAEKKPITALELTVPVSVGKKEPTPAHPERSESRESLAALGGMTTSGTNKEKSSSYVIQVAAFNKVKDAERLKASLVLTGFNVSITSTQRQNTLWYRVSIGPFVSINDAKRAQNTVMREERMRGIIRQIG